uniref:Uncharacterized protein n=1 Tax=Avena sativa TaxID=4498 RepID=A0ACD5WKD9_AVESA
MDEDTGMVVAAALTGGLFVALLLLLVVVLVRRRWQEREAVASGGRFVLFGVCFQDDIRRRTSLERSRQRAARGGEEADDQEPDEGELERWKKLFGGPNRCLSTIEEGTEMGMSSVTTPAFCSPPASPDRTDARTLQSAC